MRAGPREPRCAKPDCDNLAKAVLDALNGVLWQDDSQVVELSVSKWYAAGDESPRTTIDVEEL